MDFEQARIYYNVNRDLGLDVALQMKGIKFHIMDNNLWDEHGNLKCLSLDEIRTSWEIVLTKNHDKLIRNFNEAYPYYKDNFRIWRLSNPENIYGHYDYDHDRVRFSIEELEANDWVVFRKDPKAGEITEVEYKFPVHIYKFQKIEPKPE